MALDIKDKKRIAAQLDGIIAVLEMQVVYGYGPGEREAKELLLDARLLILGEKPENLERHKK